MAVPVGRLKYAQYDLMNLSRRSAGKLADTTALAGIGPDSRDDGMIAVVGAGSLYVYDASSSAAASANVVVVPADNPTSGRWVRPTITG